MVIIPDSYGSMVQEANPCHEPAGSSKGGQFCSTGGIDPGTLPKRTAVPLTDVVERPFTDATVIPGIGVFAPQKGKTVIEATVPAGKPVLVYRVVPEGTVIRTAHEGEFYSRKTFTSNFEGRTQVALDPVGTAAWTNSAVRGKGIPHYLVQVDIQGTRVRVPKERLKNGREATADTTLGIGVEDKLPVSRVTGLWRVNRAQGSSDPVTLTPVRLEEFKSRPLVVDTLRSSDEIAAASTIQAWRTPERLRQAISAHYSGMLKKSLLDQAVRVADAMEDEPQGISDIAASMRRAKVPASWDRKLGMIVRDSLPVLLASRVVEEVREDGLRLFRRRS